MKCEAEEKTNVFPALSKNTHGLSLGTALNSGPPKSLLNARWLSPSAGVFMKLGNE